MALVLVVRRGDPRLEALDRPRLLHLPALRVRQGRCSRSSSRRSWPTARSADRRARAAAARRSARRAADPARLRPARRRHRARLHRGARRRALRLRRALAAPGGDRAAVAVIGVLAVLWWLPAAGVNVLKPYQAARLTGFTHPSANPNDSTSYNLTQSMIAVGVGRAAGARRRRARRRRALDYLPDARHRLRVRLARRAARLLRRLGPAAALPAGRLARAARSSPAPRDLFGAIVAGGIVFGFLFQVFVNVGMTIGIAPITGIPLPFVSVGGSSMISNLVGDRDPAGDRTCAADAAAREPRRRARAAAVALGLLREVRRRRATRGRSSSAGRASSSPLLARELRAGGERGGGASRDGSPTAPPRSSGSGQPTRRRCARPQRAGVPIVGGHRRRERCPTCSTPTSSSLRRGEGLPVDEIAARARPRARRRRRAARRAPAGAARRGRRAS